MQLAECLETGSFRGIARSSRITSGWSRLASAIASLAVGCFTENGSRSGPDPDDLSQQETQGLVVVADEDPHVWRPGSRHAPPSFDRCGVLEQLVERDTLASQLVERAADDARAFSSAATRLTRVASGRFSSSESGRSQVPGRLRRGSRVAVAGARASPRPRRDSSAVRSTNAPCTPWNSAKRRRVISIALCSSSGRLSTM